MRERERDISHGWCRLAQKHRNGLKDVLEFLLLHTPHTYTYTNTFQLHYTILAIEVFLPKQRPRYSPAWEHRKPSIMQHVPEISRWEREAHYWAFLFPIQDASGNERFSVCVFKCSCRWWINQPLETPCAALASFLPQAQPPISFEYWVIKSNCSAHWGFPSLKKMGEIKTRYGLALVREYHFSAAYLRQRKEKRKEREKTKTAADWTPRSSRAT